MVTTVQKEGKCVEHVLSDFQRIASLSYRKFLTSNISVETVMVRSTWPV